MKTNSLNRKLKLIFAATLGLSVLTGFQNCARIGGEGPVLINGEIRKIDMSTESVSSEEPISERSHSCKDLDLTGTQVNAKIFPVRPGSRFMTYSCQVNAFSVRPSLLLSSRLVNFNLYDAAQVNCRMALPDGAVLRIHDAAQVNVKTVLSGASVSITNVTQANVTLAIAEGEAYQFEVSALQLNNFSSCNNYRTTDPSAPKIVIRANTQANVTCVSARSVDWEDARLKDPDGIPLQSDGSQLHIH